MKSITRAILLLVCVPFAVAGLIVFFIVLAIKGGWMIGNDIQEWLLRHDSK